MPAKCDFKTRRKINKKNTIGALWYFSNSLMEKVAFGQSIIEAKEAPEISVSEQVCLCSLTEY